MNKTKQDTSTKHTSPPDPWGEISLAQWGDSRWQMDNRLNTVEDFAPVINLTKEEVAGLSAEGIFRVDVTPYFASLMDPDDPNCPIRLQVIPTSSEMIPFESAMLEVKCGDIF